MCAMPTQINFPLRFLSPVVLSIYISTYLVSNESAVRPLLVPINLQIGPLYGCHASFGVGMEGVNAVLGVKAAARHLHV